jgi:NTE family protein
MEPKRIAIACQGGGSQCAFVAGALKTLLAHEAHQRYRVVGLSGTSGGAVTAALGWVGLLKQAQGDATPISERILGFWEDLTARTPPEIVLDNTCVQLIRLFESGFMPGMVSSPSSVAYQLWSKMISTLISRPEFTDLRTVLSKYLDFEALPSLVEHDSPVLLVGAADVLEGTFKIFSSANNEISADALLASAAVPNLFPAVWVDGHAYWDGIFSSNPPVTAFLRNACMGPDMIPEEIWIIQVNPWRLDSVPVRPSDISDRRNQMAGNLSLQHELQTLEMVNTLLEEHALTDSFRARFGIDSTESIKVRFIRMSDELSQKLDYPSKLSRQPAHISRLISEGETQALAFLEELSETNGAIEHGFAEAVSLTH